jgi:uncharacterized membrane protein
LIVVAFDHFDDGKTAMASLRSLESQGRISFEDTAIVQRDPDGTVHVRNEVSGTTETATVVGAAIGGILSFAFPLLGVAVGAALGAAVGAMLDRGVSSTFIDEVKTTLRPGRSALFLVVRQSDADSTIAALRPFSGDVIQTTLDTEAEEALRGALRQRSTNRTRAPTTWTGLLSCEERTAPARLRGYSAGPNSYRLTH